MFGNKRDSIELPTGTITEEEAVREKGLRVYIGPENKQKPRSFTVQLLDSPPPLFKTPIFLLFVTTFVFVMAGGLFMKYYPPWRINSYLQNPPVNCTVISFDKYRTVRNGILFDTLVEFYDDKNVLHKNTLTLSDDQFFARNLTIGAVFPCVDAGGYAIDKQTLESRYSESKTMWYLGVVIPLVNCVFFGTILHILLSSKLGITHYYRRSITENDDEHIKIIENESVPRNLRQYFYVLIHAYYVDDPSVREITFMHPLDIENATVATRLGFGIVAFFGAIVAAGMFTGAGALLNDYEISAYWFALFIAMEGFVTLGLVGYLIRQCILPRFVIETEELKIEYTTTRKQNQISGSISELFQGRV